MTRRLWLFPVALVGLLTACPAPKDSGAGEEHPGGKAAREKADADTVKGPRGATSPLAAVQAFAKATKKSTPDAAKQMLSPTVKWRETGGGTFEGADAVMARLQERNAALRLRLNATAYFVMGNDVVLSGSWLGVHVQEFAGVAPTKDGVGVEGAVLFRTDGKLITEVIEYFDLSSPYAQVGAIPPEKVWAQRSEISVVTSSDPSVHDDAGDGTSLALFDALHAGLTQADPPAVPADVSDTFAYWESPSASALTGDEIPARFAALRTAFPNLSISIEEKWDVGDTIIARTRWKGTHSADLGPWPAKKGTLDLECLEVVRLEDGKADTWTVHFNGYAALKAMGVIDELPG